MNLITLRRNLRAVLRLSACSLLLLLGISFSAYATGFIVTGPAKDYYWHPKDQAASYLKVFPEKFNPMFVELLTEKVSVTIDNNIATTLIEQTFYNPSYDTLQAYYLFPVPQGAKLQDFTIYVEDSKYRADLWTAAQAYYVYDDLVRRSYNPMFYRFANQEVYKVGLYTTLPRKTYTIKTTYKQTLTAPNGANYEFTVPLSTHQLNQNPLQSFDFNLQLKSSGKLTNIVCVSHPIEPQQSTSNEASFSMSLKKVKMDRDFNLFFCSSDQHIGYSLYTYKKPNEDGYFFLSFDAAYVSEQDIVNKEVVFLIDVSDNSTPDKLSAIKSAASDWLDKLRTGDRFIVAAFSDDVKFSSADFAVKDAASVAQGKAFINGLGISGKSNYEAALKYILQTVKTQRILPYYVVWVSNGGPTAGNTDNDDLADLIQIANIKTLRIYGLGMDNSDTQMLDRLSWSSQGLTRYITSNEDFAKSAASFFQDINYPVLNNLQLYFSDGFEVKECFPRKPENFFKGKKMTMAGRYKKGATINVSLIGDVNEKMNRYNFQTPFPDEDTRYDFVPRLWAMRAMASRTNKLRTEGEDEDLVDEIVELAQDHIISTPYTDYWVKKELSYAQDLGGNEQFAAPDKHANLDKASGPEAIAASRDLRKLYSVDNPKQLALLQGGAEVDASKGDNYVIQGTAMYKTGNGTWVNENALQRRTAAKKVAFASKEYFDMINSQKNLAEFAGLGRKVLFEKSGTVYEVYEDATLLKYPEPEKKK